MGAAFPCHREVALEAANVEVERERLHEEGDVDVRRENLLTGRLPHFFAGDRRAPGQHDLDQVRRGIEPDPVADGGQILLANEVVGGAHAQLTRL